MKKAILPLGVGILAVALGVFSSADTSHGAFHLMRVHAVMAGANGSGTIQYVELRMTDDFQNQLSGRHLCFYDSAGAAYARFNFALPNPISGAGLSILIGTLEFDSAWPETPDKIFSDGTLAPPNNVANMVAIAPSPDLNHPIRGSSGKVSFGTDSATGMTPLCDNDPTSPDTFAEIDSLVYGTGYTGTTGGGAVNFPPKLNTDLPTAGTSAAFLDGEFCFPGSFANPCTQTPARDNDRDYSVLDVNSPDSNNPRNNAGTTGDITTPPPDADGDGVPDATDNCPAWPNLGQGLPNTWSVPMGDSDCDGFPDTVTSGGRGRESFMGTDPVDWCADTTAPNDEQGPTAGEPLSPWPPDVNDTRTTNLSDISLMSSAYNKSSLQLGYDARVDLNASGAVNLSDISLMSPFYNKSCVP